MTGHFRVLKQFRLYLRFLKGYNFDNFQHKNWHKIVNSVCYALGTTMIILLIPAYGILAFWSVLERGADLKKMVVTIPLLCTGLQFESTYIALMMRNHIISQTIDQLQTIIDRRK